MKRCPKCNFSFLDLHQVCDFDGTDLVDDPEALPVSQGVSALAAATQSPFLRLVKSPVFLTVLLLAGILSSLLLIVYYDAASQPNSIAGNRASRSSVVSPVPPAQPPVQTRATSTSSSEISKPKAAKGLSSTRERSVTASRSRARLRSSPSIRNQQSRPEIALQRQPLQRQPRAKALQKESKESALQRDSKENANRKESKLTPPLKTPWNIIKKPF